MELEIHRSGSFKAPFHQNNEAKCGPLNSRLFKYEVDICCDEKQMQQPNEFIIDSNEIDNYFAQTYELLEAELKSNFVSCERMALDACQHFHSFMKKIISLGYGLKYALPRKMIALYNPLGAPRHRRKE